jgi:hypothetical protein
MSRCSAERGGAGGRVIGQARTPAAASLSRLARPTSLRSAIYLAAGMRPVSSTPGDARWPAAREPAAATHRALA